MRGPAQMAARACRPGAPTKGYPLTRGGNLRVGRLIASVMMRLEEWPSSTEFGLQARLHDEALISPTGGEGLQCFSESAGQRVSGSASGRRALTRRIAEPRIPGRRGQLWQRIYL